MLGKRIDGYGIRYCIFADCGHVLTRLCFKARLHYGNRSLHLFLDVIHLGNLCEQNYMQMFQD